jgi:hydrogenase nickel insertion protein HypA
MPPLQRFNDSTVQRFNDSTNPCHPWFNPFPAEPFPLGKKCECLANRRVAGAGRQADIQGENLATGRPIGPLPQRSGSFMHEVHLVRAIIEAVEKQAAANGARRVKSVKIRFNALTSHSAEHVQFSFDLVKKDSPVVQDAKLTLNEVEPSLRCAKCQHVFHAHHLPEMCPKCLSLDVQPVNSTDMVLESFEAEK